jgi:hypothetical protein
MPKLTVKINTKFTTMPLQVHDEQSFETVFLDGPTGAALFAKVAPEDLEFEVVSTNEGADASFPFSAKSGKKGSVFQVALIEGGKALDVTISGEFAVSLRSGVADVLNKVGGPIDLRIRGIMWKGGYYSGFMAWVKDSDYDQVKPNYAETFPEVESYLIK